MVKRKKKASLIKLHWTCVNWGGGGGGSSQALPALQAAIDDDCSGKGLVFTKSNYIFIPHWLANSGIHPLQCMSSGSLSSQFSLCVSSLDASVNSFLCWIIKFESKHKKITFSAGFTNQKKRRFSLSLSPCFLLSHSLGNTFRNDKHKNGWDVIVTICEFRSWPGATAAGSTYCCVLALLSRNAPPPSWSYKISSTSEYLRGGGGVVE